MIILDISDPSKPIEIGKSATLPQPSLYSGLFFANKNLIYWISLGWLEIIDIHDPTQPVLAAQVAIPFRVEESLVKDQTAYLFEVIWNNRERTTLLHIFDLSNPLQPKEVSVSEIDGAVYHTTLSGTKIYSFNRSMKDEGIFAVIDITNPPNPQYSNYPIPSFTIFADLPYGFDLYQKTIYDLADPTSIKVESPTPTDFPTSFGRAVAATDGLLYIADARSDECDNLWTNMLVCNTHLVIMDYRDPKQPRIIAGNNPKEWINFQEASMAKLEGNMLFVIDARGLSIIDIKDPSQPRVMKQIWSAVFWNPFKQVIHDGIIYHVSRLFSDSLFVYDLRDLDKPRFAGLFPPALHDGQMSLIGEDYLYFSLLDDPRMYKGWHWRVVDIHDPDYPKEVAYFQEKDIPNCSRPFRPAEPKMSSLYWYAPEPGILHFLDVTQPLSPCLIGEFPSMYASGYYDGGIQWDGKYLYLLSPNSDDTVDETELRIYDLSPRTGKFLELGTAKLPGKETWSINRQDDLVYLINNKTSNGSRWSFNTLDLTVPSSPRILHAWDSPIKDSGFVGLYTHYALLINNDGLIALDISNPDQPRIEGSFPSINFAQICDNQIFAFNMNSDIFVLRITEDR